MYTRQCCMKQSCIEDETLNPEERKTTWIESYTSRKYKNKLKVTSVRAILKRSIRTTVVLPVLLSLTYGSDLLVGVEDALWGLPATQPEVSSAPLSIRLEQRWCICFLYFTTVINYFHSALVNLLWIIVLAFFSPSSFAFLSTVHRQ